jgi:hypothetical protein
MVKHGLDPPHCPVAMSHAGPGRSALKRTAAPINITEPKATPPMLRPTVKKHPLTEIMEGTRTAPTGKGPTTAHCRTIHYCRSRSIQRPSRFTSRTPSHGGTGLTSILMSTTWYGFHVPMRK